MIIAGCGAGLVLAACGSAGPRQDAGEPRGTFPIAVQTATFPSVQTLSQHAHLTIVVRNMGRKTMPDVAVTICNVTCAYPAATAQGTSAQAFSQSVNTKYLANPSRPVWIVDTPPGLCGFSCKNGGHGAAATAYTNTWSLGPLRGGATRVFDWSVTAVTPGRHVVAWEVAAGLNGRAKAVPVAGSTTHGAFAVSIASKPAQSYVNNSGQIVTATNQQP